MGGGNRYRGVGPLSGSIYGRAGVQYGQPNVLLDAARFTQGQSDEMAIQRNRLMMDRAQMENTADQAFRAAAPGAIGGDPAALNAAIAADPERGMTLQTQIASLDAGKRKRALESMTLLGQGAASLLNLPDDQAATTYPTLLERFKGMGIDTSALPPAYPGRAAVETFARGLTPIMDQLKAQDERIVPAGDMSQPRGLRNNNPLNIEAGAFTKSMPGYKASDGRFAVFESPEQGIAAADALLMRYGMQGRNTPAKIIEKWAPAGDGNDVAAYAGSVAKALGIGPNDPIPMEDPATRRRLIDAMSAVENGKRGPTQMVKAGTGMPVTAGGAQYVQNADGTTGFQPLPQRPAAPDAQRLPPGVMIGPDGQRVIDQAYVDSQKAIAAAKGESKGARVLPSPEREKLTTAGGRYGEIERLSSGFQDDYGGFGAGWVGDAANTIARNTSGDSPRANWWQGYQSLKNVVRNDLFGAALTATEKNEFEKADINPGMSPATIRANIARQKEILQGAIRRRSRSLAADGYNADAITEATGVSLDAAPAEKQQASASPTTGAGGRVTVASDADYEALPSGTVFTGPDGKSRRKP